MKGWDTVRVCGDGPDGLLRAVLFRGLMDWRRMVECGELTAAGRVTGKTRGAAILRRYKDCDPQEVRDFAFTELPRWLAAGTRSAATARAYVTSPDWRVDDSAYDNGTRRDTVRRTVRKMRCERRNAPHGRMGGLAAIAAA